MELLTWTTDDIQHIATEEGIELMEDQLEDVENRVYESLNNNDTLNEMIWNEIVCIMKDVISR